MDSVPWLFLCAVSLISLETITSHALTWTKGTTDRRFSLKKWFTYYKKNSFTTGEFVRFWVVAQCSLVEADPSFRARFVQGALNSYNFTSTHFFNFRRLTV
jgi:hypothetical protein